MIIIRTINAFYVNTPQITEVLFEYVIPASCIKYYLLTQNGNLQFVLRQL